MNIGWLWRLVAALAMGVVLGCSNGGATRNNSDDETKSSKKKSNPDGETSENDENTPVDKGDNVDFDSDSTPGDSSAKDPDNTTKNDNTDAFKNGDPAVDYAEGDCAFKCVWGDDQCKWDEGGTPVDGDCGDSGQTCCDIGVGELRACVGVCIDEWDSCPSGASETDGNCSGAMKVCCESDGSSVSDNSTSNDTATTDNKDTDDKEVDTTPVEPAEKVEFRVDDEGHITENGERFQVRCGNWFGLEGQHEPPDAENNPDGAPMELYVGNMWWGDTGRTIQTTMTEIKALGINMIRFPISPQTLDPTDPQGIGSVQSGGVLKNHESVIQDNARQAMEDFIKLADENDLKVLVDIHSCSNYVGWRAGRLDAAPPWADVDRVGYDFKREDYTCASGKDEYNEEIWLDNLTEIAGFTQSLGVNNIIGIDIFNEPWDYTWEEWKTLAEKAFKAIDAVNPDILIFVEGIGSGTSDGTKAPHGDESTNPNWGENFYGMNDAPLDIPKERLVLSPHTYGPSVFVQKQFLSGECEGLEGDGAAEEDCPISIDSEKLEPGWEEHFGYLKDLGYGMVLGEFGGNINWPKDTRAAEQEMWSHITDQPDLDWQNALVDYLIKEKIEGCYWSINPESGDTGGLYTTPYKVDVAEEFWGEWGDFDPTKEAMLLRYWDGLEAK